MNKFFLCSALFAASASADVYLQSFLDDKTIVAPDNDVYNAGDSSDVVLTDVDGTCPPGYGYITRDDCVTYLGLRSNEVYNSVSSTWPYGCVKADGRYYYFNNGPGFWAAPSAPYGLDHNDRTQRICRKGNQGGYPGDDRNGGYSGGGGGASADPWADTGFLASNAEQLVDDHFHGPRHDIAGPAHCPTCEVATSQKSTSHHDGRAMHVLKIFWNSRAPRHNEFQCNRLPQDSQQCSCTCGHGNGGKTVGAVTLEVGDCPTDASWPETAANTDATKSCGSGYSGQHTRHCNIDGTWADASNTCVANRCGARTDGYDETAAGSYRYKNPPCATGEVGAGFKRMCSLDGDWGVEVVMDSSDQCRTPDSDTECQALDATKPYWRGDPYNRCSGKCQGGSGYAEEWTGNYGNKYTCGTGYSGSYRKACRENSQGNAEWEPEEDLCTRNKCDAETADGQSWPETDSNTWRYLHYCPNGQFTPHSSGGHMRYCNANGDWAAIGGPNHRVRYAGTANACQSCDSAATCGIGEVLSGCQDRNAGTCDDCTGKPSNSQYIVAGSCTWACNTGYVQQHGNQCNAIECASGQWLDGSTCKNCPKGKYNNAENTCDYCPAGRYEASSGSTGCDICPEGRYNPTRGYFSLSHCTHCPDGKNTHAGNQDYRRDNVNDCFSCGANSGFDAIAAGSTQYKSCANGYSGRGYQRYCNSDGNWNAQQNRPQSGGVSGGCARNYCEATGRWDRHAALSGDQYKPCNAGQVGAGYKRSCSAAGSWNNVYNKDNNDVCRNPSSNAECQTVDADPRTTGRATPYYRSGAPYNRCMSKCAARTDGYAETWEGNRVTKSCPSGWSGQKYRDCLASNENHNGAWSNEVNTCTFSCPNGYDNYRNLNQKCCKYVKASESCRGLHPRPTTAPPGLQNCVDTITTDEDAKTRCKQSLDDDPNDGCRGFWRYQNGGTCFKTTWQNQGCSTCTTTSTDVCTFGQTVNFALYPGYFWVYKDTNGNDCN